MKRLFEVYENDEYGRSIGTLGTVYADDGDDAKKLVAEYFNNKEIYTTGFYNSKLVEASINMDNKENFQARKLQRAKWDVERYSKPIEL